MGRKTPEGKVKDKVDELLIRYGCYFFMPVQTGYGKRTLDYLCCHQGRFFAVETKAPGEDMTKLQREIAYNIRAAYGHVFLVDGPEGLKELEAWLNRA